MGGRNFSQLGFTAFLVTLNLFGMFPGYLLFGLLADKFGRKRALIPLPFPAARLMARGTEVAKAGLFGLLPDIFDMTRDQVELLTRDNVVSVAAMREGRILQGLGIKPESFESFVPRYLSRFRKTGQYAAYTAR